MNGRGVHETALSDGDVISIGDVELIARVAAGRAPAGVQVAEPPSAATNAGERPLSELSAAELLDRIEAETWAAWERSLADLPAARPAGLVPVPAEAFTRLNGTTVRPDVTR